MTLLDKKKVVVGMSGGVDSSVAAYVLQKQGYEVIGVTMQVWPDMEEEEVERVGGCCGLSAVDDARRVADKLGIPFYVMNFKEIFEKKVIDYFVDEYVKGRTPNPCIACNKFMKFEELLRRAHNLGAYYVATGHYAKISYENNEYKIKRSNAVAKDQTYALYNFTQEQLKHTLMPLGEFSSKDEVRKIAAELGLETAAKPDSQEICFVKDNDYGNFISKRKPNKIVPGNFVDKDGNILGKHHGIIYYTIGQRKGLGIALGKPMYVVDIIPKKNQVVLGENEEVFGKELLVEDVNFIVPSQISPKMNIKAQIRYNAKPSEATLYVEENNQVRIIFEKPQRAITPGQAAVFYNGDELLGGGTIVRKVI
ncbi:tRNA 2-thiouridine(34) synthase MnmA [Inediibacterium massiliense]|uniref:tRNA 2-thiouridine(34) synthase MnmA n=1 Tax=Inediibacterium massiliense TaxID=1658111 RepID=UPI000A521F05|nr:tRNA 2-thiouridine(34) synthase MnmA [Inediibacterium massiliense]